MKLNKNLLAAGFTGLFAVATLAGCSSTANDTPAPADTTAPAPTTEAPADGPSETPSAEETTAPAVDVSYEEMMSDKSLIPGWLAQSGYDIDTVLTKSSTVSDEEQIAVDSYDAAFADTSFDMLAAIMLGEEYSGDVNALKAESKATCDALNGGTYTKGDNALSLLEASSDLYTGADENTVWEYAVVTGGIAAYCPEWQDEITTEMSEVEEFLVTVGPSN